MALSGHAAARDGASHRASVLPWGGGLLVLIAVVAVVAAAIIDASATTLPPFLIEQRAASAPRPSSDHTRARPLRFAGSGTNLPITRVLVAAWARSDPRAIAVDLHPSVGSTGGVRALVDGAVDVALVSRPLRAQERSQGLVLHPYARVAVVLAAHGGVPDASLRSDEVARLFDGTKAAWSDGSAVVPLQREIGDSGHAAWNAVDAGFRQANEDAYRLRRWRVLYHDIEMQEALLSTRGAVGVFDLGAIVTESLPLRVFSVDGRRPSPRAVEDGTWRVTKDLAFVTRDPPPPAFVGLFDFVRSERGRQMILEGGYMPLGSAR